MLKKILFLITILLYPSFVFSGEVSKLFNQGSYDAAFRTGYADALAGDPESSYIIGRIFIEGRGSGKEDINKGVEFLVSSAKSNYLKAAKFLGDNYYEGQFTSEDKSLALKYYEQAEKLGSKKVRKKVAQLRIDIYGAISKKSCVRYNKKDKKHYFKIADCISRNFLDGNASSYYLMAFDNGNINGYLKASQRMLKVKDIDLMPLVERIPDFKSKANKSQHQNFVNLIKRYGFDSSFCGKVKKKDRFSSEQKTDGNNAACALAAESGDNEASTIAYEWWKKGTNGFPRKVKYAENLLTKIENSEDVDIAKLLQKYESDPRLHFEKSMEFINTNEFNKSIVSKELKLQLELIAENKIEVFAKNYRDIADVLEYVNWEVIDSKILAKFYLFYKEKLRKENKLLRAPRVKDNIKKIPYNISFISTLSSLKGGAQLANQFLNTAIFNNCDALNYALKNRNALDLPYETIQEARDQSLNKCEFKDAKKSMKQLLTIAKRDLDSVKIFIEKKLSQRLPCNEYSEFLKYNRNDLDDFDIDYESLNDECSPFPVVAIKLATKLYENKFYDEAYGYALKGCDSEEHPTKSEGCDLLALMIIEGQTTQSDSMSYDEKMSEALVYLNIGHEKGDIKSSAYLHDVSDGFRIFSKYADADLAAEILPLLQESKTLPAKLQIRKKCFRQDPIKRVFNSCSKHCSWAKRTFKSKKTDPVSRHLLKPIFKDQACKAALKN